MEAFLLSVVMFFTPSPDSEKGSEVAPMNTGGTVIVGDKKKN